MHNLTLNELSAEQKTAVESNAQYLVVLASAGSGKTEVVAQRVERLLEVASDFRILTLSYTRRAAGEMRERFAKRLGDNRRRVETDTVHGFAQGLLLQYGTWIGLSTDPIVVTRDEDRIELFQDWRSESGLEPLTDPASRIHELDLNRARRLDDPLEDEWDAALAAHNALDYESMLSRALELLDVPAVRRIVGRQYRHVIVDEAQNLTRSQYALLRALLNCSQEMSAMMLGDDKQSIVTFAGADVENLRRFKHEFEADEVKLSVNFRSSRRIAEICHSIATRLGDSPVANTQTYAAAGLVTKRTFRTEDAEADGIVNWVSDLLANGMPSEALGPKEKPAILDHEIAILGRSAAALRACETALQSAGLTVARTVHSDDWLTSEFGRSAWLVGTFRPDSTVARRRISRSLGLDAVTTLEDLENELLRKGHSELSLLAKESSPDKFILAIQEIDLGDEESNWYEDLEEIRAAWSAFCDDQPSSNRSWPQFELFVSRWQRGDDTTAGIRVQTVHKSQGREYKAVAIVGLNDGQFPDFRARSKAERQSELRAFYVAASRPSRALYATRAETTLSRNGPWGRTESEFFRLIP